MFNKCFMDEWQKKVYFFGRVRWLTPVIPAVWEAEVTRSPEVSSSRPAWPAWWNPVSTKNRKISQGWWHATVVPATREAEAGDCLNLGGGGCSEPRSHHFTPVWQQSETSSQKKRVTPSKNSPSGSPCAPCLFSYSTWYYPTSLPYMHSPRAL